MEQLCWRCGDPTHHARDCKSMGVDPNLKREIQRFRKASNPPNTQKMSLQHKLNLMRTSAQQQLPLVSR